MWRSALVLGFVGVLLSCSMWNKPASGWSGATGGEQIEKLFWDDVKARNWKSVDQHVASTFTGSGAAGPIDRAGFLQQLQSYEIAGVALTDCKANLNGADVVISCVLRRDMKNQPAASVFNILSVWQQAKKGWMMVAHAETPASGSGM